MSLIRRLSIKQKTYLLVSLSVAVALILSFVSNNGLNTIRNELDDLIFSTKIERYTNRLILEEQNYRLNANGSIYDFAAASKSYENAQEYVEKIFRTIEAANARHLHDTHNSGIQQIQDSIIAYRALYLNGIDLLTNLKEQADILEKEGEFITLKIQEYVEAKRVEIDKDLQKNTIEKINNGSNIWQYTYVTRLHEKKYRLSPDKNVLAAFLKDYQFMMDEWQRLKNMSDQEFEFEQLKKFKASALKYEAAMLSWVKSNNRLTRDILPEMINKSDNIILATINSAKKSVQHMSNKHNAVSLTLLLFSSITIIVGILFGTTIARSISSALISFQNGLLNFFQYLNQQQKKAQPIITDGHDEISVMASVVNQNIKNIQSVLDQKAIYQQALLEWSRVDYQDDNITIHKATELSAKALQVERVSIWLFNEDKSALSCVDLYLSELNRHESGAELAAADYPEYFEAIKNGESFILSNPDHNRHIQSINEHYLKPLNIQSVLNLPIGQDNQFSGVICHEKINEKKSWSQDEQDFASSVVKAISLSLEIKKRRLVQEELKKQKEILHHHAHHDTLTQLPNRFLFNDRLHQAIKQAKRAHSKIAVLFIDLDNFKGINDSLGHNIGDALLVQVAKRLKQQIRNTDTLARLGGDEFTVILDHINSNDDIVLVTQNLLKSLEAPFLLESRTVYITLSVGAAVFPDDGDTEETLLKNADAAMYQAKADGRNTYQFYTSSMTEKAFERIAMETSFRNGLSHQQFVVYYQPQINVKTNQHIGVEALVRWQHPEMGLISPSKFLSFAFDTGLIVPLDLWVMETAMRQFSLWYKDHLQPGVLSLNLSPRQLNKTGFIEKIKQLLKDTGCQPHWIEFEVTEAQIMTDSSKAVHVLNQLKELGISLAIDDFGTGYSSLTQLKRLPINKLKIDQSFVRGLPDDEEDAVISKSIISLADSMGLDVIAEGVESQEQKDFLLNNGCHLIQGYYFGKPLDARDTEKQLQNNN